MFFNMENQLFFNMTLGLFVSDSSPHSPRRKQMLGGVKQHRAGGAVPFVGAKAGTNPKDGPTLDKDTRCCSICLFIVL